MDKTAKPKAVGIIPARYASTRFPGKPLALLEGKPMFWHVHQRASQCAGLDQVWLATDDQRILDAAGHLDVPCLLTDSDLPSGTDRVWQAANLLGLGPETILVNIQGDEPLLEPLMLDALLAPLLSEKQNGKALAATLAFELDAADPEDAALLASPDLVKVVTALDGRALYFSRLPIPYCRDKDRAVTYQGHLGFYAFTHAFLAQAAALPPSNLELTEKLEQLRWLENGLPLLVVPSPWRSHGVDTPEDLRRAEQIVAGRRAKQPD